MIEIFEKKENNLEKRGKSFVRRFNRSKKMSEKFCFSKSCEFFNRTKTEYANLYLYKRKEVKHSLSKLVRAATYECHESDRKTVLKGFCENSSTISS